MTDFGTTKSLSAAQLGVWYAQQLSPATPLNIAQYVTFDGPIDEAAFIVAIRHVIGEADALHYELAFVEGEPRLRMAGAPQALRIVDLRGDPSGDTGALLWMRSDLDRPVDLCRAPLFGTALIRLSPQRHVWYLRSHHVLLDGYSGSLLTRRLADVYTALLEGRLPGPSPFGTTEQLVCDDAAYWSSPHVERDREFWRGWRQQGAVAARLAQRQPNRTSLRRAPVRVAGVAPENLADAAARLNTSVAGLVIAATALYTSRMTGLSAPTLGLAVAGRLTAVARRTPGMTSNVLPLSLPLDPFSTLGELLSEVSSRTARVLRHQRYRGSEVHPRAATPGLGESVHGPVVNLMQFPAGLSFGDVLGVPHLLATGPVDDLTVNVYDGADGRPLRIDLDASPLLYGDDDVAAHHERLLHVLAEMADAPDDMPLGRLQVAADADAGRIDACIPAQRAPRQAPDFLSSDENNGKPPRDLVSAFRAVAARNPASIAVTGPDRELTYQQLDELSDRLAARLAAKGAGRRRLVALLLPRTSEIVVAVLGVLKTGAAYVPTTTRRAPYSSAPHSSQTEKSKAYE